MSRLPRLKSEWRHPADIPNQVGYKVTVRLTDGSELKTIVQKRENGLHHLTGIVRWSDVQGWKPRE